MNNKKSFSVNKKKNTKENYLKLSEAKHVYLKNIKVAQKYKMLSFLSNEYHKVNGNNVKYS